MNYVGQFCSRVFGVYKTFNPATLSGAIDIVVIEQEDGSLLSTPFHVRFGKLGILRPNENMVDLSVDGNYIPDLHMKLGEAGEAFFLEPVSEVTDADAVTPVPNGVGARELVVSSSLVIPEDHGDSSSTCSDEIETDPLPVVDTVSYYSDCETAGNPVRTRSLSIPVLQDDISGYRSDGEVTEPPKVLIASNATEQLEAQMNWEWGKLPHSVTLDSVKSGEYFDADDDTIVQNNAADKLNLEAETSHNNLSVEDKTISVGNPPVPVLLQAVAAAVPINSLGERTRLSSSGECYLSELDTNNAHLYLTGSPSGSLSLSNTYCCPSPESGYKSDSDTLEDELNSGVQISLCGGLNHNISPDRFIHHLISYEEFIRNPAELLENEDLVIRIHGKNYNWQTAAPILLSRAAFGTNLPATSIGYLREKYVRRKESIKKKRATARSWFTWGRSASTNNDDDIEKTEETQTEASDVNVVTNIESLTPPARAILAAEIKGVKLNSESDDFDNIEVKDVPKESSPNVKYVRSIRLSSAGLKRMNLKPGFNELTFSVTTKYQGTTRCVCGIHLWKWSDRIIISDIDGTITKSDVLGQILPAIGRDWTQQGVAQLFSAIKKNNYKMVYLSARAIGQSVITRKLLQKIQQEGVPLPDGPLLLSPLSLFRAFQQEVILRSSDEFKISCLKDLKSLFPARVSPFWAGFGNRPADAKSYKSVGVDLARCFTVNHLGQVKNETSLTFQSSYKDLAELSHLFFPHYQPSATESDALMFNHFSYWQETLPIVIPDAEAETSKTNKEEKTHT